MLNRFCLATSTFNGRQDAPQNASFLHTLLFPFLTFCPLMSTIIQSMWIHKPKLEIMPWLYDMSDILKSICMYVVSGHKGRGMSTCRCRLPHIITQNFKMGVGTLGITISAIIWTWIINFHCLSY